ncbi:MAG: ATP-binding protein [Myxococcota bacterium]
MSLPDFEKLGAFYLGRVYDGANNRVSEQTLLYDAKDLTTHAVCVGMTGSGKTGLCLSLLEEAALDGIPAIAIDPKGDIANLLLTFPKLAPADFRPWVDPGEATRKGMNPDEYADATAKKWREGLASWGQDGKRIERLRAAADFAIYTPGSSAGLPLSVLRSFDAPPPALREDSDALRERIRAAVSGLLALLGIEADPIRSREHILLSNILDRAWREGRNLDLAALIGEIQKPPFDRVGVLDLESFYPPGDRFELAMTLNNLLASPDFASWMEGEPLDVKRLLHGPDGKPRVSILSIAHLSDPERMFFVTLLLNEVVAWMRTQAGTSSLRALLYMDEVFGYFPPTANPPSKIPMLTLLKQARAYGLGCVLATQNPVDLDYKGLSNTGTWFLGRLQTERDKARVLDGLEGAAATTGAGFDRARTEATLSGLSSRVFLMNNVHDDGPVLFHTRWAMSYLRGPLTRAQIKELQETSPPAAAQDAELATPTAPAPDKPRAQAENARPVVPPDVPQGFLDVMKPMPAGASLLYRPAVLSSAQLHFANASRGIDVWGQKTLLALLDGASAPADPWTKATTVDGAAPTLSPEGEEEASFAALPKGAAQKKRFGSWEKRLKSAVYRDHTLPLWYCKPMRAWSEPPESEGEFRTRLVELSREKRDLAVEKLRKRYQPKLARLEDRRRRAEEKIGREEAQVEAQKQSTWISAGTAVIGALFGRKALSTGTASRVGTTLRRGTRIAKEKEDVERAMADLEAIEEKLRALEAEFEDEITELEATPDATSFDVDARPLRPRKGDLAVEPIRLVWTPWALGSDGVAQPLFEL